MIEGDTVPEEPDRREADRRISKASVREQGGLALGDGREGNRFIVSIAGRGYSFVAPVTREQRPRNRSAGLGCRRDDRVRAARAEV